MSEPEVVVVDYGVGNLFNVQRAFAVLGVEAVISGDKDQIARAKRLLLPGVGAFETGIRNLETKGLVDIVKSFAASGRPVLGVCLGMQLLMSESEENGIYAGLGLLEGRVIRFQESEQGGHDYKIPQIAWNSLQPAGSAGQTRSWQGTILEGLGDNPYMYFIHSYFVAPKDPAVRLADTQYGRDTFCSVLKKDNVSGCQFHPERSGDAGLRILANFVKER